MQSPYSLSILLIPLLLCCMYIFLHCSQYEYVINKLMLYNYTAIFYHMILKLALSKIGGNFVHSSFLKFQMFSHAWHIISARTPTPLPEYKANNVIEIIFLALTSLISPSF